MQNESLSILSTFDGFCTGNQYSNEFVRFVNSPATCSALIIPESTSISNQEAASSSSREPPPLLLISSAPERLRLPSRTSAPTDVPECNTCLEYQNP
jgi:hypothetical protein